MKQYSDYYKALKQKDNKLPDEEIYMRWFKAYRRATKDKGLTDI